MRNRYQSSLSLVGFSVPNWKLFFSSFFFLSAFLPATTLWSQETKASNTSRFLFTSQGKTGLANADGTGVKYLTLEVPNQATWQPGPIFSDGRRVVMLSMEPRRDGPGRPFDEYYTQTPTHLWQYDLNTGSLDEMYTKDRIAPFATPAILVSDERILVQVVKNKVGQIYSMRLDGSDTREFTKAGEGLPYGLSLSPNGKRVAFHLASPQGYQVWTSDPDGGNRTQIAAQSGHLYFGTQWSPDGQWVVYVDCLYQQDPAHDWADVCVGRADGSEHKVLTSGQAMWFGATYGSPKTRGGGSNVPSWTTEGQILFPRRTKDAKVPWQFRVNQPDLDHFNRDYKPELARGGTQICSLNPKDGSVTVLTEEKDHVWDFRASQSTDGKQIVFCRAATGEGPSIWTMDSNGANPRLITRGIDDLGADHPRWIPSVN
jgi:Tol biopolymer transport system component